MRSALTKYNPVLEGLIHASRDHMMDQTHVMYYYWQQPMANTYVRIDCFFRIMLSSLLDSMPFVTKVQPKKQALAGAMRIIPEGSSGAW